MLYCTEGGGAGSEEKRDIGDGNEWCVMKREKTKEMSESCFKMIEKEVSMLKKKGKGDERRNGGDEEQVRVCKNS